MARVPRPAATAAESRPGPLRRPRPGGKTVLEQPEIGRAFGSDWFHAVENCAEFFLVKLAVKIEAEQVIGERDLLAKL